MIKLNRADAIEQLILSLGALPLGSISKSGWNLSAIAEKLANELEQASKAVTV